MLKSGVRLEEAWSVESYTLDMIGPRYSHLVAAPLAWSAPSAGVQSGEVMYAPMHLETVGFSPRKTEEAFRKYEAEWRGKLRGKIVLVSEPKDPEPSTKPLFHRYSDAELAEIAEAPEPSIKKDIKISDIEVPSDDQAAKKYWASMSDATQDALMGDYFERSNQVGRFFHDEGAAGVVEEDGRSHNGLIHAEQAGSHESKDPMAPPTFVVTHEQYARMVKLVETKVPVALRLNLAAKVSNNDVDGMNIIGEIPGQKKPDEVVMIGAHFDSWHSATGATDNGAGSAVMMEVMRILQTLHLKMDRTVRIALWGGEEQGLYGSKAYVKEHFADPAMMQPKPDHAKLDVYLNLDNGSGKIRGVYLENNDGARPLFTDYFAPFHDLGVGTVTMKQTGGTDHQSFDAVGLPGFQFIQDPLDYETATHHSDIDTYSHAVEADLMQASAVIAALVYDFANREGMVPRKELPERTGNKVTELRQPARQ